MYGQDLVLDGKLCWALRLVRRRFTSWPCDSPKKLRLIFTRWRLRFPLQLLQDSRDFESNPALTTICLHSQMQSLDLWAVKATTPVSFPIFGIRFKLFQPVPTWISVLTASGQNEPVIAAKEERPGVGRILLLHNDNFGQIEPMGVENRI